MQGLGCGGWSKGCHAARASSRAVGRRQGGRGPKTGGVSSRRALPGAGVEQWRGDGQLVWLRGGVCCCMAGLESVMMAHNFELPHHNLEGRTSPADDDTRKLHASPSTAFDACLPCAIAFQCGCVVLFFAHQPLSAPSRIRSKLTSSFAPCPLSVHASPLHCSRSSQLVTMSLCR